MRIDNSIMPTTLENVTVNSNAIQSEVIEEPTNTASEPKIEPQSDSVKDEKKQLQVVIKQANKALESVQRHFKYEMHKATKQVVITVIDDKTNEVIGEIPPKKLLDAVAKLWELAGLFVDERR